MENCGLCGKKVPRASLVDHWVVHALEPINTVSADSSRLMKNEPLVFTIERPSIYNPGTERTLETIRNFYMKAILTMKKQFPFLRFEYHIIAYHRNSGIIRSMLVIAEPR